MSIQGMTYLETAISTVMAALVLLATVVQSATLADNLVQPTTSSPALSQPTLTTQLINGSMEEPRVLQTHKPCREEHANYCLNDGQCMYPQDTDSPSCMCKAEYSGERCILFMDGSQSPPNYEKVIGISLGVALLIFVITIIILCCIRRRCKKSGPLIKSHGSENSV